MCNNDPLQGVRGLGTHTLVKRRMSRGSSDLWCGPVAALCVSSKLIGGGSVLTYMFWLVFIPTQDARRAILTHSYAHSSRLMNMHVIEVPRRSTNTASDGGAPCAAMPRACSANVSSGASKLARRMTKKTAEATVTAS